MRQALSTAHLELSLQLIVQTPQKIEVGPFYVDVWPEHKQPVPLEQAVCYVVFDDNDRISGPLIERLLAVEAQLRAVQPPDWLGGGGIKIRDISEWDSPSLRLLNERALELYRRVRGNDSAVIDDMRANVTREGEYIGPHAHHGTKASLVNHLLPPPMSETSKFDGSLGLCDPRLSRCCPVEIRRATSQIYPPMNPGCMVIFPSFVSHYVTPFIGTEPRISIA